ncbi:hypothetical protein [Desulfobacca acetoxidans]|uniref:Uncharacterized protein n=1 Tax=Desulfobacca acetoxidans (strain ATCC 700848 / DSM 11109 / ASRB2) TaxID=880072 RepID=F2NF34_DESAR|nr:hypothetical protein [Desulfobacca acetoxidans]AEB08374.1 hypothetical protein Desac_0488 [Desulfobacca acetoxidans DSM 11109]HAY22782.1 hypothetical protein [Desulfobacterales bacterium]
MATCSSCQAICEEEELREYGGERLCEDCYINRVEISKTCDPWAVHSAKSTLAVQGLRLTPNQEKLLALIRAEKEVDMIEAAARLKWSQTELQQEFTVLRHMELLRGVKKSDGRAITLF